MMSVRRARHLLLIPIMILSSSACATAEFGRKIHPEEVAWIEKGVTTRTEVVQKLGAPFSEVPDWTSLSFESTSTITTVTETTREGETEKSRSVATIEAKPTPARTKALYNYTKTEGSVFTGRRTTQEWFYVIYDQEGVVQEFAFQAGHGMTIR